MRMLGIVLILSLGACSQSADKQDLANAGEARSLLAEAAFVLESGPRTTPTYSAQMHEEVGAQLATLAAAARGSGSADGAAIAELASLPPDPGVEMLHARVARARAIEDRIEKRLEAR